MEELEQQILALRYIVTILLVALIVLAVCFASWLHKQKKRKKVFFDKHPHIPIRVSALAHVDFDKRTKERIPYLKMYYSKSKSVMNQNEQKAFYYCQEIIKENQLSDYYAFPQVKLSSFVRIIDEARGYPNEKEVCSNITSKSVDILIFQKDFINGRYLYAPVAVFEIDGSGHVAGLNAIFKNELFRQLGIPFCRIDVPQNHINLKIKENIKNFLLSVAQR